MKYFFLRYGKLFFWLIAIADLLLVLLQKVSLRYFTKPLLMPVLAIYLMCLPAPKNKNAPYIIAGLLFAAAGDIFLMLEKYNADMFIFGLAGFLITHLLYILFFAKIPQTKRSLLLQKPAITLLLLAYFICFLVCLFPHLGALKIPVIIYTVVIGSMFLFSVHVYNSINKKSGFRFVLGALMFVLSDSLLAFNKFLTTFPFNGLVIMATYCIAQFLITEALEYL